MGPPSEQAVIDLIRHRVRARARKISAYVDLSPDDIEEIVSLVLLRLSTYVGPEALVALESLPPSFLYPSIQFAVADWIRDRSREAQRHVFFPDSELPEFPTTDPGFSFAEDLVDWRAASEALTSPEDRALLDALLEAPWDLHVIHSRTAELLGLSKDEYRYRLRRLRSKLSHLQVPRLPDSD